MRTVCCACVAVLAALVLAAPASAEKVLELGKDGRVRAHENRFIPATGMPAPPRRAVRARASVARVQKRRTVIGELQRLQRAGALAGEDYASRVTAWRDARKRGRRLKGTRGTEMRAVLATIETIARRGQLTRSRVIPLWLTLQRNLEWWTEASIPSSGQRMEFEGSELVWQYYPGQGIQLQMLGNFGKLNGLWGARRTQEMGAMVDELVPLAVDRAGGLAWEYYFTFNGGRPPWVSGMAQGTAVQAISRVARRLKREDELFPVAQRALTLFDSPTPQGVRVPGERRQPLRALLVRAVVPRDQRLHAGARGPLRLRAHHRRPARDRAVRRRRQGGAPRAAGVRHRRVVAVLARQPDARVRPRLPRPAAGLRREPLRAHRRRGLLRHGRPASSSTSRSRPRSRCSRSRCAAAPTAAWRSGSRRSRT